MGVKIMETILRDAHQSLIATRMPTEEMLPIVDTMDQVGYHAVECWGGATFDSCLRFLHEDPWDRLRKLRDGFKHTKLQMLFRGQNILGYKPYADDVVEYFVQKSVANGIDIIRIFDCMNDLRNLQTCVDAAKKEKGAEAQVALSYTLGDSYTLDYWTSKAKAIEEMGADSICIKDMAGLLMPYQATELVKALAEEMFDSPEPLIRLDMTEYMEKHSVARMIGSPPGYVGYDEAGQLTEKVRRRPYSVILFDEIEKAHPDVMNILMQILDEGKVDDAQGRTINFENTIICMTSNAGSTDKSVGVGFNRTIEEITKDKAMKGLKDFLRPEFISRIDEIVVFKDLTKDNFADIAALMLNEMKEPLAEKNISITYTDEALKLIAEKSFGKPYGARDIRRVIRQEVEDKIAEIIIENASETDTIAISANGEELVVEGKKENKTYEA